jgi:hypothetical protein
MRGMMWPPFFIHAFLYWIKELGGRLLRKISIICNINIYPYLYYPAYLRNVLKKVDIQKYEEGYLRRLGKSNNSGFSSDSEKVTPVTIQLATIELPCDDIPNWLQTFKDLEITFSLHRWGWLLMLAVNNPSAGMKNWGLKVMKDWFLNMGNKKWHPAWESYSASERIVNALLFFYVLRDYPCSEDEDVHFLENNLIDMTVYLKNHLEFHSDKTNNHVLNNARALYMLGRLSSCEELAEIGRRIFIEETSRLITASGFLREDSSSYHFLLLRTYLEVLHIAEYTKDIIFAERMKPVATSMVKAAWIFDVYNTDNNDWNFPLIGDASPDFPINWLKDICRSIPALELYRPFAQVTNAFSGWNKIWDTNEPHSVQLPSMLLRRQKYQMYKDSGWYRVDYGNFTIIWHIYPSGSIPLYSHGHSDIFSFVLYWRGRPVIVDSGRFSYTLDKFGLYGKTTSAHNTFTSDGFDSYPVNRSIYPPKYREGKPIVKWEERGDDFYFKISHDGFQRLNEHHFAYREFHISYDTIKINDFIQGFGCHNVKTFFHFADDLRVTNYSVANSSEVHLCNDRERINAKLTIAGLTPSVRIISGVRDPDPIGWVCPEYGRCVPTSTCIVETYTSYPYKAGYSLGFVN